MATDRPRYTVSVDNDLFEQIEDFRFANRFATRSDATVELIKKGLEAIAREKQPPDFERVPPELYTHLLSCDVRDNREKDA